jgi:23S rRNA pseudouridine1911/1915/1917 synthase
VTLEFIVAEAEAGQRLDRLLADRVPQLSRTRLGLLLAEDGVAVNGEPAPAGRHMRLGDRVALEVDVDAPSAMTPEAIPLPILFEDEHLIVVVKPSGMVSHPSGRYQSGTLTNALAYHFNVAGAADPPIRPGIAHRLDKDTSGVMVVAKTQAALSRLTVSFQQSRVGKRYVALVAGRVAEEAGRWEAPIGFERDDFPRWGIRPDGRAATSEYRVRERLPTATLLELMPVTGRTNQLRLHCAHFGHPILGDTLFGPPTEEDTSTPGRLFLHAERLVFLHPATREELTFEAELPSELATYLDDLRKEVLQSSIA